jgi:5-carboxymethyl-2-hydroxymuconate isomerase
MPHMILEYSDNVIDRPEPGSLLRALHDTLVASGPYDMTQIKSRILIHDKFLTASGNNDQAFVHLELAIMPRDENIMKETSEKLLTLLQEKFPKTKRDKNCSFSVDIRLLEKDLYRKTASGIL